MIPLILPIGALLAGVALLILGVGLLNTILALRSNIEGYGDSIIGMIMSSYFVGFFIGTYAALPLVRRIGHIRAFASCASVVSVCVLLHQMLVDPYAWMLIRVMTGTGLVILYTVIESWLNGQTSAEHRGKVFAVYMIVNLCALALAQQLVLLDPDITFLLFALASVLISLSLVPVTWTRMQQPAIHHVGKIELRKLWRNAPVAVFGSILSGVAMGSFWGLAAVYGVRVGLSNAQVASFVTSAVVGGALCQLPLGRFSDQQDRRRVLMLISLSAGLFAILLALWGNQGVWPFLMIAAYGAMSFAIYPVAVAHMVDHLDSSEMLAGGSGMLLLHGIGAVIGPALCGQLMQWFAPWSLPAFWAVANLVLAAFAWWVLYTGREENPAEHAADFVPMVRTTPTALELLPAGDQGELFTGLTPVWGHDVSKNKTSAEANLAPAEDYQNYDIPDDEEGPEAPEFIKPDDRI